MQDFTEILQRATAAIAPQYFRLPVHGADPIYRERVYCYELYHQMRALWPGDCPWFLNGEVDKQQHPYFQDGRYPKPDFVVHVPGTGDNYAAIEVKPMFPTAGKIRKDVETLLRFRDVGYGRALYLIYGSDPEAARKRVARTVGNEEQLAAIELWVHQEVGAPAVNVPLLLPAV